MSGILKVGGSELINDNGGSGALQWGTGVPAGHVLQIKESVLRDVFEYTNASEWGAGTASTRADQSHGGVIDDLSLTLTTKGANSTFYIYLHLCQCSNNDMDGGYNFGGFIYNSIDSYADPIDKGNASGNRKRMTFGNWENYRSGDYITHDMGCQISHTSSLAKGSSLSYRTVMTSHYTTGGNTIRIGRDNSDSNASHSFTTVSTFRVIEVAT